MSHSTIRPSDPARDPVRRYQRLVVGFSARFGFDHRGVVALRQALEKREMVVTTGLILQELLQGFAGPRARKDIIDRSTALPFLNPDRVDHIDAAELRNRCRRAGAQIGTIDALLAQLCLRHALTLLTTDKDFDRIDSHVSLRLWRPVR